MPASTSPLSRAQTIAWYSTMQCELKQVSNYTTADALYELTNDESITADQCQKWSKGQRCAANRIRDLNKSLPPACDLTYEVGPEGESLWPAFRLPSTLRNPLSILIPANRPDYYPPSSYTEERQTIHDSVLRLSSPEIRCKGIRKLAVAVAAYMFKAESFVLAEERNRIDMDAPVFFSSSSFVLPYGNTKEEVVASHQRLTKIRQCFDAIIEAAEAAEDQLAKVGLAPPDIYNLAYNQFAFLASRKYPQHPDAGKFDILLIPHKLKN